MQLPKTITIDRVSDLHEQVYCAVYGVNGLVQTEACPFAGFTADLMSGIDSYTSMPQQVDQIRLLFVPVCIKHRQCVACFQEADDMRGKGMRTLRQEVLEAARRELAATHKKMTAESEFKSPLLASSRALMSGCTITLAVAKRWTTTSLQLQALMHCTQILTFHAPHWKGGTAYLATWNQITRSLESDK